MLISGMTSVTFRSHSVREVVALCKKACLAGIEWGGDVHVPPENAAAAKEARERCADEGLKIYSYGSYYSPTKYSDYVGEFEKIAEACLRLGCAVVRIWAGEKWRCEASDGEYAEFVKRMRKVAFLAQKYGMTVCYEHHQNTYCDGAAHTLKALSDIGSERIKTYWQPICQAAEENLKSIAVLKERVVNMHVYHWTGWDRHLLCEGEKIWRNYLAAFSGEEREIPCLLEFALNDDENNFFADAACLKRLLNEGE